MVTSQEKQQQHKKKWKSIQDFLRYNTGYKIHGVARAGSTVEGGWTLESDLDIRFAIANDPSKTKIYPNLRTKLREGFPDASVEIGKSYNVINMEIGELEFDIVLLTVKEFDTQVREEKLRRT